MPTTADIEADSEAPAIWRRIRIEPADAVVAMALEDNFHHFRLALRHTGGIITAVEAAAERFPWSTCFAAAEHFIGQSVGRPLADVAAMDPKQHCTHLMDLLALCSAWAEWDGAVEYDLRASRLRDGAKTATLRRDGLEILRWRLEGTLIASPDGWEGLDLRRLSSWRAELDVRTGLEAMMMRRVAFMADQQAGAGQEPKPRLADNGDIGLGACFTYQMPRARDAMWMNSRRTFTAGGRQPLRELGR